MLDSAALGVPRGVTVYCLPSQQGPLPACVLADGRSARGFAHTLEPAILAGAVPAVLLVGVHNAVDPANPWPDRRAQEYLPGHHRRRFDAHPRFVTDEVIPWATRQHGAAAEPWVAAGVRHYLAAGTLERGFRQVTRQWAERLQRAGLDCRYHQWVGGHDHLWWKQQLPAALQWLLG